ncbi:MAG: saccharopine dehydrogenase NADP-binding domain-containing protein [Frankiaceae bacterium]
MPGRIVVFGATGFTGRLVVAALVARGARPVLAGRGRAALEELAAASGGLDVATADAAQPGTVRALVGRGDALVTTVGPFTRYGAPALDAALDAGAHYVDSTGEASFVRAVWAAGPRAEAAGSALLTAFGFDFVPGNLAGALALRDAGAAARGLEIGYFVTGGGISSGTRASGLLIAGERVHARRGARLVELPLARETRTFEVAGRSLSGVLFGGTEPLALPRLAPGLTDVTTYLGGLGAPTQVLRAVSYALPVLLAAPGGRAMLSAAADRAMRRTGSGPGEGRRGRARSTVVAVASDAAGAPLSTVALDGPDPYDLTGALLADAAVRLAGGEIDRTGALGPVDAYGVDGLEAACAAAGLRRAG